MTNWKKRCAMCILSLLMLMCVGKAELFGCAAAADAENESYVIANLEMGKETRRVLSLMEGPVGSFYFFSYQTDAGCSSVKLCCDTYVDGQKTEERVLLDFDFAETPYAEPRRGDIFISTAHRYTTLNETYYKDVEVWDKDGSVIDILQRRELTRWDTGAFPQVEEPFVAPTFQVCFPVEEASAVEKGTPVNLLLMVESAEAEAENWSRKTAQELLDNPDLLGASRFHVFYCVFA